VVVPAEEEAVVVVISVVLVLALVLVFNCPWTLALDLDLLNW
jgi:uncharacterized membrane protein YadS